MEIKDIKKIIIEGAGTMGSSMAQIFATSGFDVVLHGRREETLLRAKESICAALEKAGEDVEAILSKIKFTTSWEDFSDADVLVENIAENLDVKKEFFAKASEIMKEDAMLSTNTSGLSITKIAEAVKKPERFAGFHWFNPPHIVPLIEVIAGDMTEEDTVEFWYALAERIGKEPIRVKKDVPGFIANRIQLAVLRECIHMYEMGVGDVEDFDRCMKYALGFRYACLGPLEVVDHGGIDIFYHIAEYLYKDLCSDTEPTGLLKRCFDEGNFGVKTGKGFYDYEGDKAKESVARRNALYQKLKDANLHE